MRTEGRIKLSFFPFLNVEKSPPSTVPYTATSPIMDDAQFSILSTLESNLFSRTSSPMPETFSQASTFATQKQKHKLTALSTLGHSHNPKEHESKRAYKESCIWLNQLPLHVTTLSIYIRLRLLLMKAKARRCSMNGLRISSWRQHKRCRQSSNYRGRLFFG